MKHLSTKVLRGLLVAAATLPAHAARAAQPAPLDGENTPATHVFEAAPDEFRADAALDLRYLNEKVAGERGFIRRTADGESFVHGDGTPVRFWAVGSSVYRQSPQEMERHARFLAKMGVNMVRLHASFSPRKTGAALTDVNEEEIDKIQRYIAALKQQGIYTTLSPFWAHAGHSGAQASWGLEGYGDKDDIWGLLFFNDTLQNAYKGWMKTVLTRPNPYANGVPLAQDPALAIIQVQNEDSLFFWTTQRIKPPQMRLLNLKFGAWLTQKYGSLDAAQVAWEGLSLPEDDFANGVAGLFLTWDLTQNQTGNKARRVRDQTTFLAELQRGFYAEIARYLRDDLGCQQLTNASNWKTASNEKLGDLERWTYAANDVMAGNKYYNGGEHVGEFNGWRIDPGHFFTGESALKNPTALPTNLKQPVGFPFLITESTWVPPLGYQSEGPLLMAAYQSLSGVDAFYWFNAAFPGYNTTVFHPYVTLAGDQKAVRKWELHPSLTTQFPAAALMFRRGDIAPGATVVHEERSLPDLFERTEPLLSEGESFDPNRQTEFAEGAATPSQVDPLAFLAGRVEVKYGGDPRNTRVADLTPFINRKAQTVSSTTGEIKLDYGTGLCTIDTPRAQSVIGFLQDAGGQFALTDTTVRSANQYAAVTVISLDDKPLAQSGKVLVQVGTAMRLTGWKTEAAQFKSGTEMVQGLKIVNTGKMPWQVVNAAVTVRINNPNLSKARALDSAGYRGREIAVTRTEGALEVTLPSDALWLVLE